MVDTSVLLTIGEVSHRTGVATSALRFYESTGLISSSRTEGNQRRYQRSIIRTIAVIKAAQRAGIPLDEIGSSLADLPSGRVPTREDWESLSKDWATKLEVRIARLQRIKQDLSECIGCGCLSIDNCSAINPGDELVASLNGTSKLEHGDEPAESQR
jgi:MerR family redox-sensitive transcriptional activator SoxR